MQSRNYENVYFAVGVQGQQPARGRGKEVGVIALPGLWGDVDVLGPNHAATNLPPTLEDAWGVILGVPFRPTIAVYTGGGLQPLWLFREPMEIATDEVRRRAKRLSNLLQAHLAAVAARNGWSVDNTADLCRLLRVPGTYNRKQQAPVLVRYEVINGGQRYNPSEFEEFLGMDSQPAVKTHGLEVASESPSAEFASVLNGCAWIRHCKDDAPTLSEPEWSRMLSIVGRCENGKQIAHDLSRPYRTYTARETDEKLQQAVGAAGPATCAFIEGELGQQQYCARCKHHRKIKSPIVLGSNRGKPAAENKSASDRSDPTDNNQLTKIQITDRQLRDVSRETLVALKRFNHPPFLFVRSGKPVCLTADESGRYAISDVSDEILRNRLARSADFYRLVRETRRNCAPPMDVVRDILAMPPVEWEFPTLHGIIASPAFREDGSVIFSPGYDAASGLYYSPDPALLLPDMPDRPTESAVRAAIELIFDILVDFPFVDEASHTNAIAVMLTSVCRPAIKGPTPLALFDATSPGTGKTLLAEVISLIVSGRDGILFSAPREADEWRKQLTSVLREGSGMVIIDNVDCRLDSADLCKALTETTHGDRILGKSQTITLPVRCIWIATGNNLRLGGDIPRRCYWIQMDAMCPRPFERTGFRHTRLKQYVLEHRGEILCALLVLARSWFVAGRPQPDVIPVGGFEEWTTIVGGILQHVGVKGFLSSSTPLYTQADDDSAQWECFLRTLYAAFYREPFTVAHIWNVMNDKTYNRDTRQMVLTARAAELRASIPGHIAETIDREGFFKHRLGNAFSKRVGRRHGDGQVRVEREGNDRHGKVARWKVSMSTARRDPLTARDPP
jgi:hypothetical protein